MKWRAWSVGLLACLVPVFAAPVDDLASPNPDIRAYAARVIRDEHLYQPTPHDRWDKLAANFTTGESSAQILRQLQQTGFISQAKTAAWKEIRPGKIIAIRLDDSWTLNFAFDEAGLVQSWIADSPREVDVVPPAHYSGSWHNYRVDGEAISTLYVDGKVFQNADDLPMPEMRSNIIIDNKTSK